MASLNVQLHPRQLDIFNDPHRFKVVAAGRRFGKSRLAAWILLIKALQSTSKDVFYVAPTFQQAKDIMWSMLKELGHEVIVAAHENTGVLTLVNGRKVALKGSDRPDTLRGVGLAYAVLDELGSMKPFVWEQIVRPALADVKGGALFIGTPVGRNHFYDLYDYADSGEDPEWSAFHFTSFDNPFLDPKEIEAAKKTLSTFAYRQEFLASFEAAASDVFKDEWIKFSEDEPKDGDFYMAVDLAGFADIAKEQGNKKQRLDESALALVKVNNAGWWVKDIQSGRWDVRETAVRILKMAKDNNVRIIGIEKGALANAIHPYLLDIMKRVGYFPRIQSVTHGNQKKTDRIVWSLQGRFEHGRIVLNKADWNAEFLDQLRNFPNSKIHDDLVDALSYVDQVAVTVYERHQDNDDEYEVFDPIAAY